MPHPNGGLERGPAILDPPASVEAAMREGEGGQPLDALSLGRWGEGSVNQV
jgi:hypothetical protein